VQPGSIKTLYRLRRALVVAAVAAPVLLLAGVWALVTQVLMVPAVPDATSSPEAVFGFIVHPKGLPRLDAPQAQAVIEQQLERLRLDSQFRQRFLAEYRVASPDEQSAFRANLFDVFKPLVLADVRKYHELPVAQRPAYLDERIVAYNRLKALWGEVHISKHDLGPATPGPQEALQLLMQKTTEEERRMGLAYAEALRARVEEILADPALKTEFESRIAASGL